MQYRIRPVQEIDLPAVVEICREHADYEKADYIENDQESKLRLALFSEQPQLECWVVATEEGLIGYTTFMMQFSTWDAAHYLYMDCLFLLPEARSLRSHEERLLLYEKLISLVDVSHFDEARALLEFLIQSDCDSLVPIFDNPPIPDSN